VLHTHRPKTSFKARPARGTVVEVSCETAQCLNYLNGWKTILSTTVSAHVPVHDKTSYGLYGRYDPTTFTYRENLIEWIRAGNTNRRYTEQSLGNGLIEFVFEAGQQCFTKHYQQDMVFDIARVEDSKVMFYPDGDAFIEDSDKHLRKIKEVVENG